MNNQTYTPNELPKSITRKIYVYYFIDGYSAGRIEFRDYEASASDRILIASQEVTIEIPPQSNIKEKVIEVLNEEIQSVKADCFMKVKELQEKIDSLLSLTYQPND